jgi:predicted lipoprotein with Yx(FWY)xxD motif
VGDFTILNRPDGRRQWTYKGYPLYRYDGDLQPGDATGMGVDKTRHVAMWRRYSHPKEVKAYDLRGRGQIWTTPEGLTLYRRDGYRYQAGGHSLRNANRGVPAFGKMIGTGLCDADCLKTWKPLIAPADAVPSGYWEVIPRPDGTTQWSYQGYVLYTYAGDKKPGDMVGNDVYEIVFNDGVKKPVEYKLPMTGAAGLYWKIAAP